MVKVHSRRAIVAGIASLPVLALPVIAPTPAVAFTSVDLADAARTIAFYERCNCKFRWHAKPFTFDFTDMSGLRSVCTITDPEAQPNVEALRSILWKREHQV
jgi:hypothetical protein